MHNCCSHSHQHHSGNKKGLIIALIITSSIAILEFFGGLFTNSLALLSDSGHMLVDSLALLLSLIAIYLSIKSKQFKYESYVALFNGLTLTIICLVIIKESFMRLFSTPDVAGGSMIVIAFIGLIANGLSAYFLMSNGDVKNNINLRSAYLHVIGDMLGSVGVIVAGLLISLFSWNLADPIAGALFAIIILKGSFGVIKDSLQQILKK